MRNKINPKEVFKYFFMYLGLLSIITMILKNII